MTWYHLGHDVSQHAAVLSSSEYLILANKCSAQRPAIIAAVEMDSGASFFFGVFFCLKTKQVHRYKILVLNGLAFCVWLCW